MRLVSWKIEGDRATVQCLRTSTAHLAAKPRPEPPRTDPATVTLRRQGGAWVSKTYKRTERDRWRVFILAHHLLHSGYVACSQTIPMTISAAAPRRAGGHPSPRTKVLKRSVRTASPPRTKDVCDPEFRATQSNGLQTGSCTEQKEHAHRGP